MRLISPTTMAGIAKVSPLLPGTLPFGMVTGVAAANAGFDPSLGIGYSIIVFAGASQLAMLQLLVDGAWLPVVILTGLVINLRFGLYSATIAPYLTDRPFWQRLIGAYMLTDQAFGVSYAHFVQETEMSSRARWQFYFGSAIALTVVWITATVLGYWLSAGVPKSWRLEFAVPLGFIALMVPGLRDRPTIMAALVAGCVCVLLYALPLNLGLFIGAAAGVATGYLVERRNELNAARAGEA